MEIENEKLDPVMGWEMGPCNAVTNMIVFVCLAGLIMFAVFGIICFILLLTGKL